MGLKRQAAAATSDEARQDLAGHRGHAGADLFPQAAEGLERQEDQRGAVRHGRLRWVSPSTPLPALLFSFSFSRFDSACRVMGRVCVCVLKGLSSWPKPGWVPCQLQLACGRHCRNYKDKLKRRGVMNACPPARAPASSRFISDACMSNINSLLVTGEASNEDPPRRPRLSFAGLLFRTPRHARRVSPRAPHGASALPLTSVAY